MGKFKLVCFDLDDTLIYEIDSVMIPCIINGKENEQSAIREKEKAGQFDYVTADHMSASLFKGLQESKIKDSFLQVAKPIDNIGYVVDKLHENGMLCIVITVGPKQVAKAVSEIWGFDGHYGSDYEVIDGVFTGNLAKFVEAPDKIKCLMDFCGKNNIASGECIAVGDGVTDIPIFEYCAKAIAINAAPDVKLKATHAVDTQDLTDILKYIL